MTDEPTRGLSTVAEPPPWELERRARPTWGLARATRSRPAAPCCAGIGGGRRYEVVPRLGRPPAGGAGREGAAPGPGRRSGRAARAGARGGGARSGSPTRRSCAGSTRSLGGRFPHLLIEHLEGPTLCELILADGRLAVEQLLPLGLHVASALHYLAAEGMVHLDVKPDNIVMGAPPRLIDLSVARHGRRGARACARRSAPTPTWRPSSAIRRAARSARRRTCSAWPRRSGTRSAAGARSRARARSASRSAPVIHLRCPAASPARSTTSSARGSRAIPPHGRPRRTSPPGSSPWWRPCRAGSCSALAVARGVYCGWVGRLGIAARCRSSFALSARRADPRRTRRAAQRRPTQPGFRRRRPRPGCAYSG